MLSKILEYKELSPGAIRVACWLYGANGGRSVQTTLEKLAAYAGCSSKRTLLDAKRDGKTVRGALWQLVNICAVPLTYDADRVEFSGKTQAQPVETKTQNVPERLFPEEDLQEYEIQTPDGCVYSTESVVRIPLTPEEIRRRRDVKKGIYADCRQLSVFDAVADVPQPERTERKPQAEKYEIVQAAALCVRKPCVQSERTARATRTQCAQAVREQGTDSAKRLADAIENFGAGWKTQEHDYISAQARTPTPACTPASKEKPIYILNQSTNESLKQEVLKPMIAPKPQVKFNAAEREKRKREILERFPELRKHQSDHVVGTLANMMAFGSMPESVYYQALQDTAAPTVRDKGAFLNSKVQKFKKVYRYSKKGF